MGCLQNNREAVGLTLTLTGRDLNAKTDNEINDDLVVERRGGQGTTLSLLKDQEAMVSPILFYPIRRILEKTVLQHIFFHTRGAAAKVI